MIDCVLCMDIGTTSLKAGLITVDGEVVSFSCYNFFISQVKLKFINRWISKSWIKGFFVLIKKLRLQCRKKNLEINIKAVGISGNGPTIVCENGFTIPWNENYPVAFERTQGSLFLSKVIELKEKFPNQYNKTRFIFSGPEYLIYKITGKAVTVLPEERFEKSYWTKDLLIKEINDYKKMPPFVKIGEKIGVLKKELINKIDFCSKINNILDIPVFSAGPDFVAALIGTNTLSKGKICDRAGSSEGINYCISENLQWKNLRTLPSVIKDLWNISSLIPDSSKLNRKKRLEELYKSFDELKKFAKQNNLEFPDKIVSTGGQTKNKKWMMKKSKKLRLNFSVSKCADSELLGDAAVCWYGIKKYNSLQEAANHMFKEDVVYEGL